MFETLIAKILLAGSVGSALIILINIGMKPIAWIKSFIEEIRKFIENITDGMNKLNDKVDNLKKEQDHHTLDILSLIIVNKNMSDEKRYNASKKYLEMNGNSGVEIKAKTYIDKYEKKVRDSFDEEIAK